MRLIAIGALLVGALAVALLLQVTSHTDPTPGPAASQAPATSITPGAPPATGAGSSPGPVVHARAMPAAHAAPTLAPAVTSPSPEGGKPKHIDTPTDILRWSLMRAIRTSEPAVIDCLDRAKLAGTVVDGRAVFAFYVTETNGKAVISRPGIDTSAYPDAVNACILATLAGGELDQQLPDGQPEFRVLRELIVDKGTITTYKLKSFVAP